jgi:hypothetical protein
MSNNILPITELDFFAIKQQLKNYLKTQTKFKDYDYEGSNMSVLLDVLSYNTFQNNFYTNMAINEMFLDSAQLKSSVVSHAKELNYIPRSNVSPKAIVRVTIKDSNTDGLTILIPKFSRFSSQYQGQTFTFVTDKSYLAYKISPGTFVADNVEIYEGEILEGFQKDGFIFSEEDNVQSFKCVLQNENVDISSIRVFSDDDTEEYVFRKDIYGVEKNDLVFYVEPYFDDKYAVVFGGNVYGKQPPADIDIKISYRVTNGPAANGASRFSANFRNNVIVETISPASGGQLRETLESIKFFAPKSIQIQERAVTSRDYEILLKQRYPEIKAVSVFGGDELDPPKYGKVAISISLDSDQKISTALKNDILQYLSDKTPLTIRPIFIDAEYLYAQIDLDVNYTLKVTSKSQSQLEQNIRNAIKDFADKNLNNFGSVLRHSRLSTVIDSTDISILSNMLVIKPYIKYVPPLRMKQNEKFNFGAELKKPYNKVISSDSFDFEPAIKSTVFNYKGVCCFFRDDGNGNIQIVSQDKVNFDIIKPNIGTVDYRTGLVRLSNFIVDAYPENGIKVLANMKNVDIIAPKNRVFLLKDEDVSIRLIEESE